MQQSLIKKLFNQLAQKLPHILRGSSSMQATSSAEPAHQISAGAPDASDLSISLAKQKQHMEFLADLDFYLEYQPQVTPHNNQFIGSEALLRARDAQGEVVMPYVFLPWLENAGMMRSIDLWVANEAVKQSAIWHEMGLNAPIKINVTSDTLMDEATTDALITKIAEAQGRISIEIVEQDFSAGLEKAVNAIARVQAMGGKVYIDDFGTGYSSLSYLNSLKADCLKIDRSFVLGLDSPEGEKVMAGIFNFAQTLGYGLVIEGVETQEQLAKIPNNIPFAVQGWLYSKAIPADQIPAFAQQYSGN